MCQFQTNALVHTFLNTVKRRQRVDIWFKVDKVLDQKGRIKHQQPWTKYMKYKEP